MRDGRCKFFRETKPTTATVESRIAAQKQTATVKTEWMIDGRVSARRDFQNGESPRPTGPDHY